MQIADVYASLVLDDKDARKTLTQDLPREAAKGGQKAGQSFGGAMGAAVRTTVGAMAGGVLGGLVGMAAKATAELDTAMGVFAAETGATQAEMESAQKTISSLYRENLQGFDEIGDALGKMRTDLGLTQEEANAAAESFLDFATATRQDAGEAVSAFDDILDNWGLTAKDAQGIMDRLVKSHQEYGGSVQENQKTLAALAPSMKAANMEIDDGIALLNLFGAKGLDANTASAAFSKSLTKVKSPEELQRLIDDISATEDPFKRAEKAAELFGARAGAKLANALGGANLDEYAVSIEDAAGATKDAATAIEGSFGNRFKVLMKNAGGALAEFGQQFGPILLIAGQFGPSLVAKIGAGLGGLAGLMAPKIGDLWTRVASSGPVTRAVAWAATKSMALYVGTVAVGDKLAGALSGAWSAAGSSGVLQKAAQLAGSNAGKFFASGLLLGLGAAAASNLASEGNAYLGLPDDATLSDRSQEMYRRVLANHERDSGQVQDAANAIGERVGRDMGLGWVQGVESTRPERQQAAHGVYGPFITEAQKAEAEVAAEGRKTGYEAMSGIAEGIRAARQLPLDAFDTLREMLKNPMTRTAEAARIAGQLTSKALAAGLRSNDPAIRAQAQATKAALIERLTQLQTSSGNIGKKAGKELAAGLKSKDPQIRAAARDAKEAIDDKLEKSKASAGAAGAAAGSAFSSRFKDSISIAGKINFSGRIGGYASGAWEIPYDQLAVIHKGEMVIPARPAEAIRGGAAMATTGQGGGATTNVNVGITGLVRGRDPMEIASQLRRLASMGALAPRESLR